MHDRDTTPAPLDEGERLLAGVLAEIDAGTDPETVLARHPEHAETLRRRLDHLGLLGMDAANAVTPGKLGVYRLERLLGRGGMAEVWLARQEDVDRPVALKLVRDAALSPSLVKRFHREAQALGRLRHPNIVTVHGAGREGPFRYIAMELIEGRSLADVLEEGPLPVDTAVAMGRDLARALDTVHTAGIAHRDVKPSNVLVADDGRVVLIDFGLTRGVGDTTLSVTGRFLGSPQYAAPEQIRGEHEAVGPASDVYSLGATLYEALAGSPPFDGAIAEELFRKILLTEPARLRSRAPTVPADLEAVIDRAMEKRSVDRYVNAAAFAEDLEAVLERRSSSARPPGPWKRLVRWRRVHPTVAAVLAVLIVSVLVGSALWLWNEHQRGLDRTRRARDELDRARGLYERYLEDARDLPGLIGRLDFTRRDLEVRTSTPEERHRLNEMQREIESTQARREQFFTEVIEALRRAESLDPGIDGPERLRAQLYFERWRQARIANDATMTAYYASKVREHDDDGDVAERVELRRTLTLRTTPPGARVDAFVFRRHDSIVTGGEPRLVPVPWQESAADGPAPPGTRALKVRRATGTLLAEDVVLDVAGAPVDAVYVGSAVPPALEKHDRIVAIDGAPVRDIGHAEDLLAAAEDTTVVTIARGPRQHDVTLESSVRPVLIDARRMAEAGEVTARIWRDGVVHEVTLAGGSRLRPTAAPLWHGPSSFVGTTPLKQVEVRGPALLLLLRAPGFEPMRLVVTYESERTLDLALQPSGALPAPFVTIEDGEGSVVHVMDREVNFGEYIEFLRDADLDEEGRVDGIPVVPRGPPWRGPDGRLRIPAPRDASWPASDVSWEAAGAYVRWRNRRAATSGSPWRFALPEALWMQKLLDPVMGRIYPWGSHFRTHFAKSCFSRDEPRLEPALRYPVDESPLGLHDTAGGVAEFCSGWFWRERGLRQVHGGAWAHGEAKQFRTNSLWGIAAAAPSGIIGFRLVATRAP